MTFSLSGWMLYTMLGVLAVIGLDVLAGFYRAIVSNSFSLSAIPGYLGGILSYVFPLLVLAGLVSLDPTGILVLIGYYLGGIGVILKYLNDIKGKLQK